MAGQQTLTKAQQLSGCGGREDTDREKKEIKVLLANSGELGVVEKSWKI